MKTIGLALGSCLVAAAASAQPIAIHGAFNEKTVYNTTADWNTADYQEHWAPCDDAMVDPNVCHLHLSITWPDKGEQSGPIQVPFIITLFHFKGHLLSVGGIDQIGAPVWDATGDTTLPACTIGIPTELVTCSGHLTIDISSRQRPDMIPEHGWGTSWFRALAQVDNGAILMVVQERPLWSNLTPSAPIVNLVQPFNNTAIWSQQGEVTGPAGTDDPLSPWNIDYGPQGGFMTGDPSYSRHISGAIDIEANVYIYDQKGGSKTPESDAFTPVLDPDLHHGIPGTPLPFDLVPNENSGQMQNGLQPAHYVVHVDPSTFPVPDGTPGILPVVGPHKVMIRVSQTATGPSSTLGEIRALAAATLQTFPITVDSVGPPQPLLSYCSLGIFPQQIAAGQSVTLGYATKNATLDVIDNGVGSVPLYGIYGTNVTLNPTASTTYTLTATAANGSVCTSSASVLVGGAVITPPPPPPPLPETCTGTVTGASVDGGATIQWAAPADVSCVVVPPPPQ